MLWKSLALSPHRSQIHGGINQASQDDGSPDLPAIGFQQLATIAWASDWPTNLDRPSGPPGRTGTGLVWCPRR